MTATTLTDSYIAAVTRGVPAPQRTDLESELRASLADEIDSRIEAGADPAAAERDAITALGDPIVLAARYSERPLHLIGPRFYADWKRLLSVVLVLVVPITIIVVFAVTWARTGEPLDAVGEATWTGLITASQLALWTTVLFAALERLPHTAALAPWTPDMLAPTSFAATTRRELVNEGILVGVSATAIAVLSLVSPWSDQTGAPLPFLDPFIWTSGIGIALVLWLAAQIGFGISRVAGKWRAPHVVGAIAFDVIGGGALIALGAMGRVLNPEMVAAAGWSTDVVTVVDLATVAVGIVVIAASLWENLRSLHRR